MSFVFRLILILVLLLVIYWAARSLWRDLKASAYHKKKPASSSTPPQVTDKLVKDPVCGVYCAKRSAYTAIWKGKVYYFCSEECRQKFLAERESASSVG